jgi:predicted dehydrogenase
MGVTFQNRFFPAVIMAKHLIEDGFLGDLLSFRAAYLHSGSADPDAPLKWKMTASAGGGVLADLGSHVIDLVSDLAGPIEELVAHRQQAFEQRPDPKDPGSLVDVDAEDDVMLLARVRSKTGLEEKTVAGTIEASKIATGAEDELRFELSGVNGAIRFNSLRPGVLETFDAQGVRVSESELHGWTAFDVNRRFEPPATQFPGKKFAIGWPRSHSACLAAYMKAVHAGTEFHPNAVDGLYVQRVMEACRRSWKSGSFERVLQV